jgi:hypothetical protein
VPQLPHYQNDLPSKVIEDVKVRCLFTMQVQQKKEYFGDLNTTDLIEKDKIKINTEKMRKKLLSFGKQHKEFPQMQISFLTRARAMEICFGDPA